MTRDLRLFYAWVILQAGIGLGFRLNDGTGLEPVNIILLSLHLGLVAGLIFVVHSRLYVHKGSKKIDRRRRS